MTTEETLRQIFSAHGYIERVKKQNDYAFIHFRERQDAEQAISARNDTILDNSTIEVNWSKPVKNREQYRLRRGDRGQPNLPQQVNPFNANALQYLMRLQPQAALQQQLMAQQSHLQHHESRLQMPALIPGFSYLTPLQLGSYAPPLGFQHMHAPSTIAPPGGALHHEAYMDEASRQAQFVQPMAGNAPGAVRRSVSPVVHSRPYQVPVQHIQQQQQQQQQQPTPLAPYIIPPQYYAAPAGAGYEIPLAYPPTAFTFPDPASVGHYAPPRQQDFYRPQYQEQ